mgnify:CR=1 FL=1
MLLLRGSTYINVDMHIFSTHPHIACVDMQTPHYNNICHHGGVPNKEVPQLHGARLRKQSCVFDYNIGRIKPPNL